MENDNKVIETIQFIQTEEDIINNEITVLINYPLPDNEEVKKALMAKLK